MMADVIVRKRVFTGFVLTAIFISAYLWLPPIVFSLLLLTVLGIILLSEWPKIGPSALTPWYPILPFVMLIVLNHSPSYRRLLPVIFIITALFDMGAYFFGTWLGKRKLVPTISPGKTWEGLLGGIFLSFIGTAILFPSLRAKHSWGALFGLVLGIDCAALFGDLFISFLKRRAGIKDCGTILPGHGGFLDRFDSITFVTFVVFIFRAHV